ncbi:ImmA/IrrE family metallo-endopeptidase [Streptococcus sanguinis]|uniref:ImmA/IrrE family metallo-endopeptidase n=1 Tax=Streptococcus sanguinis TaxID=1305 RepID=UPI001CBE129E|nr:ImmA/IrrE family metallo-endopeptidase [Streptococcus sanguinis]MBZ2022147.1 ImmA/IrrE family metallo-endopeptidase [Streptococcus sanguinis]MBZ2073765.1 ImmA/IrrE family metallo-endopeptidase [Streptococcus sanguinis]MBZ2081688.1 ImmA/IrrE family metallo-endopeptidase [Streptococcus sanguinis]MCC3165769.1 hypothetical protein [Streptococcus sanguinis]
MDLPQLIRKSERDGFLIIFKDKLDSPGRLIAHPSKSIIIVNNKLPDYAKINVILHELAHAKHKDPENILSQVPTFLHHIETRAEKKRITDFMKLINLETPIDENFNYLTYMQNAFIEPQFENFVKETARKLYEENKRKKSFDG